MLIEKMGERVGRGFVPEIMPQHSHAYEVCVFVYVIHKSCRTRDPKARSARGQVLYSIRTVFGHGLRNNYAPPECNLCTL